jgi:hypothetical protein
MAYITLSEEVDVSPEDWFDEAYDDEREEMYKICRKYFEAEETLVAIPENATSIQEQEFIELLKNIKERYLTLTAEQINQLKNI